MKPVLLLLFGVAGLAGCHGKDNAGSSPTPPAAQTNFTTFVKGQIAATTETSAPVDVSGVTFSFADEANEAAFNDILPP